MPDGDRWDEAVSRWQELCAREGRDVTAREVWPDASADDLAKLERRLRDQRLMRDILHPAGPTPAPTIDSAATIHVDGHVMEALLGRGGFGEVWKARQIGGLHPYVALKIVDLRRSEGAIERASLASVVGLNHAHIVTVHAAWEHGGRLLIKMDLADGGTLGDRFEAVVARGEAGIERDELLRYIGDAAEGLDFLNAPRHPVDGSPKPRIYHCDVKPENLLLFGGTVKVGDFGVLRVAQHTLTGPPNGSSRPYAPPEFFKGMTHQRSDQYSLAVVYCKLRGGRFPYDASTPEQWMHAHLDNTPDLTMLPCEDERKIVARALRKDPDERWADCREFVCMLRSGQRPPASAATTSMPNPSDFFSGRADELERLRAAFTGRTGRRPNVQALSGQGGNGKTQLALMYADKFRHEYTAQFLVRADSVNTLQSGFVALARQLRLAKAEGSVNEAVAAAREWLDRNPGWLLILDNADDPEILPGFVPRNAQGHTLLTSRAQQFDALGVFPIFIGPFRPDEAVQFLVERTGWAGPDADELAAVTELARELGELPLALEQAGAYIAKRQCGFRAYLTTYRNRRLDLLNRERPVAGNYPHSVETTWTLNFEQVADKSAASADLLKISALLLPVAIPLELIERGAGQLGPEIASALARSQEEPVAVDELLEPLTWYSLIRRDRVNRTYSMHVMVQEVLKSAMPVGERTNWTARVVAAAAAAFLLGGRQNYHLCERLVPHILSFPRQAENRGIASAAPNPLFSRVASYLTSRGQYAAAQTFLFDVVDMWKRLYPPQDYPDGHRDLAQTLHELAGVFFHARRLEEAERICRKVLKMWERLYPPDVYPDGHRYLAESMNDLASYIKAQGRAKEAEQLYRDGLAIWQRLYPEGCAAVVQNLIDLASVVSGLGRHVEAEILSDQATKMRRKHPLVVSADD